MIYIETLTESDPNIDKNTSKCKCFLILYFANENQLLQVNSGPNMSLETALILQSQFKY